MALAQPSRCNLDVGRHHRQLDLLISPASDGNQNRSELCNVFYCRRLRSVFARLVGFRYSLPGEWETVSTEQSRTDPIWKSPFR
jgi:hypothetical protein